MKRLLLVSGNLSLRMAVGHDYEIVEQRPSRNWRFDTSSLQSVDAVLLDLHNEEATSEVLERIFADGYTGVVLVCAVADEDWSHIADRAPDRIAVVELPVNGAALSAALNRIVPSRPTGHAGGGHHRTTRQDAVLTEPVKPAGKPAPPPTASPASSPARQQPAVSLPSQRAGTIHDHVRELADALPQLRAVGSVAEELVEAAVAATSSEAGAALVPDGAYWRVAAGVGVRHVEWRLAVAADTWLIDEVVAQRHGIVVEDTDIARQRLSGLPLASWEQLTVVPVRDTDVVVMVARHEGAYTEDDVRVLSDLAEGFRASLAEAMALRDLARSLQDFADADLQDEKP